MKLYLFSWSDYRIARHTKWHRWFAWFPVKVAPHEYWWLETVERRGGYDHQKNTDRRPPWRWDYRKPEVAEVAE